MNFLSSFDFGGTTVRYPHDSSSGRIGLELFPTASQGRLVEPRVGPAPYPHLALPPDPGNPPARPIDALAQIKRVGDPYPGAFAQGHTLRNSPSVDRFRFVEQTVVREEESTTVLTVSESAEGHRLEHRLIWRHGEGAFEIRVAFQNRSALPVVLEMLGSFCLGGITPFACDDAPGRLRIHRFRSGWSAEGRLETRNLEELHLERSWSGAGMFSERFGQVGTMPVRRWFPFVAAEDAEAGVLWGAQLAWAGSWQMELFRQHDSLSLSGGLADREFGHWMKTVAPGESLEAPPAFVASVQGTLDDLCDRLTARQHRAADSHPAVEHDLPIVFNEWCTTWGDPQHDKVAAIARRLRGSLVKYLVIDAGWYKTESGDWNNGHGDWVPSRRLFPQGLEGTAEVIRREGLIPGLWFEMETCGSASTAFSMTDRLLKRDGIPVTVRDRRFWDLNDPAALAYLTERVIGLLERGGFGYLKVDYNETLGLGSDHPDSLGEGLRRQVEGSYRFFEKIRARLPDLVIENCASGGHRLEPSMLGKAAMSSFSDAHEVVEIPIIAAGLHRLMLPRQSQIWAVLHRADSDRRLAYSLAATFLGRMCLSGEIAELTSEQWALTQAAQRLYRQAAPIIKYGSSRHFGRRGESWRHPAGWQAVLRLSADRRSALLVFHAFAGAPSRVTIPLPGESWRLAGGFPGAEAAIEGENLAFPVEGDFSARVLLLARS